MTDVGDNLTLRSPVLLNGAGIPANPVTLGLTITLPDATTVVKAIGDLTNDGTGRYHYAYTTTLAGVHTVTWDADGNGVTEVETQHVIVGDSLATDGPCSDWLDADDVFDCKPTSSIEEDDRDYVLAARMATAASRMLFIRNGRTYTGVCRDVVRPCRRSLSWPDAFGHSWHGSWGWCSCGARTPGECGCPSGDEIQLGGSPILGIKEILIDGDVLASSAYQVRDSRVLARIDGESWGCCQDLTADPETDDNTFQVTYFYGRPVPEDGVIAARRLAAEMYLACAGSDKCQLPRRVRSLVRQGIEVAFIDPQEFFGDGGLGIWEVDAFLSGERYDRAHRPTVVASPDFGAAVRRVTA